ncbi:hypothetical protein V8C86DRAFT_2512757 [Haematococcus lacustris]
MAAAPALSIPVEASRVQPGPRQQAQARPRLQGSTANDDDEYDRRSVRSTSTVASTVATTASLVSRIAALQLDYTGDKPELQYEASILEGSESGSDAASEDAQSEEDRQSIEGQGLPGHSFGEAAGGSQKVESPIMRRGLFQICSRLFMHRGMHPYQMKRITAQQAEVGRPAGRQAAKQRSMGHSMQIEPGAIGARSHHDMVKCWFGPGYNAGAFVVAYHKG